MKPVFHAGQLNGPFDDPCVYARILRDSRAVMFDCGDIRVLEPGHILKISDIFITHMHIDHFIGIDSVLRVALRRGEPLSIYGPESIISCIEGKLKGYSWNLISSYPVKIEVFEVDNEHIQHASFHAANAFGRIDHPAKAFSGTVLDDSPLRVKALQLRHDIPVLAYSLEEEYHININKALLQEMELPVGPWLSALKGAIRQGAPANTVFDCYGRMITKVEVMPVVTITRGQKISYVMDVSPDEENIAKIIPFVAGSDTLFCEAYFLGQEIKRATERHHLTASIAGRIAREGRVENIEIMHISPKYRHCADEIYREVEREFRGTAI
ncbi:MAG: ribonuclease Z [Dissulfurispiraceae bacterium]